MLLEPYICITFFFISLGLVRLVSLVSFSKRMEPPGSILFNFIKALSSKQFRFIFLFFTDLPAQFE